MLINLSKELIEKTYAFIMDAHNIAIIPHRSPDGDAIGSALAMKFMIESLNKNPQIVCVDPAPSNTHFLPDHDKIIHELTPENYDLLIYVDCGGRNMPKFGEKILNLFDGKFKSINIDHHKSDDKFGTLNLIEQNCASTTQILYFLCKEWNIQITPTIATCLQTGLYFDTGSFKHNNTTISVLKVAAELTKLGADCEIISKNLFKINSTPQLKLWGEVFNNIKFTHRKIVTSAITNESINKYSATSKDLEGVIDYLNAIPNSSFSILLSEDHNKGVKASLRTQNPYIDLTRIAKAFGGGGHKMAAGFRIDGEIKSEKYWKFN